MEIPSKSQSKTAEFNAKSKSSTEQAGKKSTSAQIAKKLGIKTTELNTQLLKLGYFEDRNGKQFLSEKGKLVGGESRNSPKFGTYFLWPDDFKPLP
jgi:hypothetical protein